MILEVKDFCLSTQLLSICLMQIIVAFVLVTRKLLLVFVVLHFRLGLLSVILLHTNDSFPLLF